ncbi:MAG: LysR family transcriptional regulator [Pseudomonadota bacterium]
MPEADRRNVVNDQAAQLRRGLDLRQLQVFVEIAAVGNVTSAAHRLGISQAAASQQIARLEERLGMALLDRSGRELRLTTVGARLLEDGRQLLEGADALFRGLEAYRTAELPSLRLHILESLATILVPPLVPRLRRRIGQLEVRCALQLEREHELIFEKDAIALTSLDLGAVHDAGTRPILSEPFVAILPARHRDDVPERPIELNEIGRNVPFIRYLTKRRMAAQVETAIQEQNLTPSTLVTVDGSPAMVGLVAAGCGWTITTPSCLLTAAPPHDAITVVKLERSSVRRRVVLIADDDRLMDFPAWIAAECCEILQHQVAPRLNVYGDWLAPMLEIGDNSLC